MQYDISVRLIIMRRRHALYGSRLAIKPAFHGACFFAMSWPSGTIMHSTVIHIKQPIRVRIFQRIDLRIYVSSHYATVFYYSSGSSHHLESPESYRMSFFHFALSSASSSLTHSFPIFFTRVVLPGGISPSQYLSLHMCI